MSWFSKKSIDIVDERVEAVFKEYMEHFDLIQSWDKQEIAHYIHSKHLSEDQVGDLRKRINDRIAEMNAKCVESYAYNAEPKNIVQAHPYLAALSLGFVANSVKHPLVLAAIVGMLLDE